jgi:RNA-directed DNA polymerase
LRRIGNIYKEVISSNNLFLAYKEARKNKRNRTKVYEFEQNFGSEMAQLVRELKSGVYKPKPYKKFLVHEPKERVIYAPAFRDVIVQHAIYRIVYNIYENTFITQSHGCRKGYGIHSARDSVQRSIKKHSDDKYYLQLDIKKYFYSFDRSVLRSLLQKRIKDKSLVDLMMMFTEYDSDTGVPIGNLLSQLYGLIYLNPLDHYIKRYLKIKDYVRYVDDFILIGLDLREAQMLKLHIETYLASELGLTLSKAKIVKIKRGVDFVGYRIWKTHVLVRKYSMYNFKRMCKKKNILSIVSMIGHANNTQTLPYYKGLLEEYGLIDCLPRKAQIALV